MRNYNKKFKYIFTFGLVAILFFSCTDEVPTNNTKKRYCLDEPFKSKVEFVQPVKTKVKNDIQLTGIVKSNPNSLVSFNNLVDGSIVKTHFELGEKVTKGQVLAEVKSVELSKLASRQKILRSKLEVSKSDYQSMLQMFQDGIASRKDLNIVASEVKTIESELSEIDSNLEFYNASQNNGVFLIKAPSSGYIIDKNITQGMNVTAYGDPLFTISKLSKVWVHVNIHASHLSDISKGMDVEIRSLSYPDSLFHGKINAISHVLDDASGVIKARVELKNTNLLLKPGMFVNVIAKKNTMIDAYRIPTAALIFDDNKNYLVLYKDDCDIIKRKVEYIYQSKTVSYLPLDQVQEDDQIISKNQLLIYEQIKNEQNTDE